MCGITGIVRFQQIEKDCVDKMTETLQHRGPDQRGFWKNDVVHFGHRRLAIIDLENGIQPFIRTVNGISYVLIFNGEIYNANTLKEVLQLEGYVFETTCDTEVLLYSFIHWKEQCVQHINGIYAFAVYIEQQSEVYLIRDRVGVKPLFYSFIDGHFVFASEIKSILAFTNKRPPVTIEGLKMLLSIGPSRVPGKTVYENIYEIPPAHFIKITSTTFKLQNYYEKNHKIHRDDFKQTVKNVRELVIQAVERQLMSDVPICSFLSGGIDSSIISLIAHKKQPIQTFSLAFQDNDYYFKPSNYQVTDDNYWVDKVSTFIGTNHQQIVINEKSLFETLITAMKHKDYPSMADIDSSLFLFCKEVSQQFKVALSGECADELFAGYPWFQKNHEASKLPSFPWITSILERDELLKPIWREKLKLQKTNRSFYEEAIERMPSSYNEDEKLYFLNEQYFMQTLLERKDRMSMATSLEVRVPFADDELIDYVWSIPIDMKQYEGKEKGLLREAFKGLLPDEVLYRKKNPFPKTHHPNFTALVKEELTKRWQNPHSILRELFEVHRFEQLLHSGGSTFKKPWFGQLMTGPQLLAYLIQLDEWFNAYEIELIY